MVQPQSLFLLEDASRLAALTPEQRTDVAQRLEQVTGLLDSLVADIDRWLPREPTEPTPLPQAETVVLVCSWCGSKAIGVARMTVLGIDLGTRPSCLDPDQH